MCGDRLLAEDLEEVVEHLRVMEALDEHEEGDGRHAPVESVVEAHLERVWGEGWGGRPMRVWGEGW